eukprot:CAMPEP_0184699178 /NCGR_PEP_ID=MMETSP0313-20130426/5542_1 /TAXON_ID=2792 /ORGANISM="Porphyridium aerugineum, Strain SAG 1380-2" /LENGTH=294 /DNA_ID=CAMNT_0027158225 /DNA_START=45 /DNA_END=929 /DNA_ORIENTATION=-
MKPPYSKNTSDADLTIGERLEMQRRRNEYAALHSIKKSGHGLLAQDFPDHADDVHNTADNDASGDEHDGHGKSKLGPKEITKPQERKQTCSKSTLNPGKKDKKIQAEEPEDESIPKPKPETKSHHAPAEYSSKKRVKYLGREIKPDILMRKKKSVDPRFEEYTGPLSQKHIRNVYSFVEDIRDQEKENLRKVMKKTKSSEEVEGLARELQSMESEDRRRRDKMRQQGIIDERISKEKELVKQGKTPYFLKSKDIKEIVAQDRYNQLRKSGNLKKYIEKKRKSNASKDRRLLPNR